MPNKPRWWSGASARAAGAGLPEPEAGLLSDPGCHRQQNEDSARIVHNPPARGLLLIVADGMGGHEAGEVASQAAVAVVEKCYRESRGTPGEALAKAFRAAHRQIFKMAAANASYAGMGTTCTALALVNGQAWAAHVGDSRLYLVRGPGIYQLSEDHTQCMELVRKGLLTPEQARKHEDRNVLLHAMGTRQELTFESWSEPMPVEPGDCFVLCSDGLHDLVSETEIREVVRGADPETACGKLVAMARDRGGYDNITVAVAAVAGTADSAPLLKATRPIEVHE